MPYRFAYRLFASALIAAVGATAIAQAPRPATTARPPATAPKSAAPKPAGSNFAPISRATFIATMDEQYKKLDANNDGVVTKIEIEASKQRDQAAALAQQARQLFVKFDTDHNGQLSLPEFIYATSGGPQQQRPDVTGMMSKLDANRDNKVTLVEYRTLTLTGFDKMDTDKDGIVSVAEQRAGGLIK